jgi:hypothetical protein
VENFIGSYVVWPVLHRARCKQDGGGYQIARQDYVHAFQEEKEARRGRGFLGWELVSGCKGPRVLTFESVVGLRVAMETIAQNLEWLWKMSLAAKKGHDELEETLADVITRLEARIGEVRALFST